MSGNNQIDPIFLVLFLKDLLNTLIQLQLFRGSVSHQFPIPNTRRRQIKHFPKPARHRDNQQLLGSRSHGYFKIIGSVSHSPILCPHEFGLTLWISSILSNVFKCPDVWAKGFALQRLNVMASGNRYANDHQISRSGIEKIKLCHR